MLRVVQVGLGPIGVAIAERVARASELELVGAVDPKEGVAGRDLGEVLGVAPMGIPVSESYDATVESLRPDVAMHATGSHLEEMSGQLIPLLRRGVSVVSTCEELSYPAQLHPEQAERLDSEATKAGVVLLGTGVTPGFVMDKLVVTLMSACDEVRGVRVRRILDAARRREPFQRKVGGGLSPEEFDRRKQSGGLGHVGLAESAQMLADVMGLDGPRELRETLRPMIAERVVTSDYLRIEPGQVAGIDQTATIAIEGSERVRMELQMYLGASEQEDAVSIDGSPPLEMTISTGVPGDSATAAVAVHCAPLVPLLAPGLRTMLDVPLRPPIRGQA
jgi:4-hydroxy-tetrahydrodipicolinate reductase